MRSAFTLGLAGLSVLAAPVLAQNRAASGRGTGSITVPNTAPIPLYHVNFNQSGRTLTLVFVGKNPTLPFTLEGRITGNASGSDLPVEITGGLRDPATRGSGRILLSGSGFASADLSGTGKEGPFRLEFRGDGSGGGGGGGGGDWDNAAPSTGVRPINMSTRGRGTYELSGRRSNLDEMRIRLYDDGRAELRFDGDRGEVEGKGTWRRGYNGRGDIDITEWNGRRTSGSASLTYRGRDIERAVVNIPAQNARVEFLPLVTGGPGNIGGGNTNAARPVNTSFVGTGGFRERGRTYQLSDVSIRLRDNGEAELRFEGDRRTEGRGRWTADGIYARISITEWDGRRANGSGTITFSRNLPDQVNLTTQGRTITFRSNPRIQPR